MKPVFTLIFLCCIILHAQAQIVYTDVNPDKTFNTPGSVYHLDLNNDGINDFDISYTTQVVTVNGNCHGTGTNRYIQISSLNQNEIDEFKNSNDVFADSIDVFAFDFNQSIDSSISPFFWNNGVNQILTSVVWGCRLQCLHPLHDGVCGSFGWRLSEFQYGDWHWVGVGDRYIGLRLYAGSNIYYGWVRLNVVDGDGGFTIKDYAYNSIPNQPILTGQTAILPVTLLSFSGFLKNNQAVLTWSTANEINNKGFDVERSEDGKNFIAIGFVKGKGNTSSVSDYNFTDAQFKTAINFYRLKQIDNDGKFKYSNIIKLTRAITNTYMVAIAPNPFSNSTTISFSLSQPQSVSISIYDMNGRLIKTLADAQMQAGTHQLVWNTKDEKGNEVSAGIYVLRMQAGNYIETKKLVVVK